MSNSSPSRASGLDKFLRLFANVSAGEGFLVVLMFLNIFLILQAYYILKPIRDSLIGNAELFGITGDQLKSYLAAAMAFLLIFVIKGYSSLTSRYDRIRVINITSIFIVACVMIFFTLLRIVRVEGPAIAIIYFLWIGIVNNFIIAQFWSYANDLYTEKQGKRLFAVIAIGQSTGAIAGSWLARSYGKQYTFALLLSSAFVFAVCAVLYNFVNRRVASQGTGGDEDAATEAAQHAAEQEPLSKSGGFSLVAKSPYLLAIALMIFFANTVNTNGEWIITNTFVQTKTKLYPDNMYTEQWVADVRAGKVELPSEMTEADAVVIADEQKRAIKIGDQQKGFGTAFFGDFYFLVNVAGAFLQMFVVSRIFKYIGVRAALFILPMIAFGGAMFFGFIGTLMALRIAKTAENSTDYSLQNTVKQALFLPTTREEKYKAKAAIDTFFVRSGDTLSAIMVAVGANVLAVNVQQFAFANAVICAIWIALAIKIFREHKKLVPEDRALHTAT